MKDIKKKNRLIGIIMAVCMAVAMGFVSSVIVTKRAQGDLPPFPVFCLINMLESVAVGVFLAFFVPFHKITSIMTNKFNAKVGSLKYIFINAIPYSVGNGLIISSVVSFINIASAHHRAAPGTVPPLFFMWFGSWGPLIIPCMFIGYIVSILLSPIAVIAAKAFSGEDTGKNFKWFQIEILIVFSVLITIVTFVIDFVVIERSKMTIRDMVSELIAANSRQIELNINSYLESMETTPTLLFSDEMYYEYDPTDPGTDEYEKVKDEEAITNRIADIGLMSNYIDFGIIYENDHKVGWVSHGTQDLLKDDFMYDTFSALIDDDAKQDGWCFGVKGDYDKIYYIKRLNPKAILVSSCYTRELSSVFVYPEQLEEMNIRLVDPENRIIYSSVTEEIGEKLPEELTDILKDRRYESGDKATITDEDYFVNLNVCSNGWAVICSVPSDIILKENTELRRFTIRISVLMAVIFVLLGLVFINRLSAPMDDMVTALQYKAEVDRLSGVMNKTTFEEAAGREIANNKDRLKAFIMMDMDNFKKVNDNLGHSYGDQVIIRFGLLLHGLYGKETVIGRLGGDEFAVYLNAPEGAGLEEFKKSISEDLDKAMEKFSKEFSVERDFCGLSFSAGIYTDTHTAHDFKGMYERADKALYESKENGKGRYTFLGEDEVNG